jgi:hypothetical protein
MKASFRNFRLEDYLNILSILTFVGALIYFIVTDDGKLLGLGQEQQFCTCVPTVSSTVFFINPPGTRNCMARVNPSLKKTDTRTIFFETVFIIDVVQRRSTRQSVSVQG